MAKSTANIRIYKKFDNAGDALAEAAEIIAALPEGWTFGDLNTYEESDPYGVPLSTPSFPDPPAGGLQESEPIT